MEKMGNTSIEEHLQKGSKVEVFSEEDGLQNSWFPAVILRPPYSHTSLKKRKRSSDSKAFVQYDNFLTDRTHKPLTGYVDVSCIRPLPPLEAPEQVIELNDVVDALYRDVWWTGVVINVVSDKYYVKFKFPTDILELERSQLRLHWDWVHGIWTRPEKQETTGSSLFSTGEAIEVNLDNEIPCIVWSPATFLGEVGPNYFLVQAKDFKTEEEGLHKISVELHQIRPHPPQAEVKFDLFEKVDAFDGMHWWVGVITKVLTGRRYIVNFMRGKKMKEFDQSELRPHLEWVKGRWGTISMNVTYAPDCKPQYVRACNSTKNSTVATQNESSGARMGNTEEETSCSTNKGDNQKEQKIKEQEVGRLGMLETITLKKRGRLMMPRSEFLGTWTRTYRRKIISKNVECLVTGSTSEVLTVSHAEESSLLPNEIKIQNNVGVSNEIQGKGEEDILPIADGQAGAVGEQHNGAGVIAIDCATDKVELPMIARVKVSGDQLNEAAGDGNCRTDKSELTVRVSGTEDALRDGTALVSSTDCLAEEVMVAVDGISSNDVSDNQPLSMSINEIRSIENANDSGSTGDIEQNDGLCLPFVKSFPIWQQIESMEVFRKLPQNPHFQPLVKSKEVYREGLAIGNMLAFVSFVEMIAKLEIDAPVEFFNDATETLVEMEMMGFNVEALRGRLCELQLVRVTMRRLQDDSEGVRTKITESTHEKTKTNEEVDELLKEMKKLEEKKARLIAKAVAISTELDMLQSEDSVIIEDILRMKQNFLVLRQV